MQGKKFRPYEINSLVRTIATQFDLGDDKGSKASLVLPIHTIGKAFDFPVAGMDKDRLRDLLFILYDMDSHGMISYSPEYQTEKKKGMEGSCWYKIYILAYFVENRRSF